MNHNFVKVAAAIPTVKVADCKYNATQIGTLIKQANEQNVQVVCFPELAICADTCADLFFNDFLLEQSVNALFDIAEKTKTLNIISIIGVPIKIHQHLFNCAAVVHKGEIISIHPKTHIPNHGDLQEQRWFSSSQISTYKTIVINKKEIPFGKDLIIDCNSLNFSIEIGEDLFVPIPPSCHQATNGAQIIFNPTALNATINSRTQLVETVKFQSNKCIAGYICASAGFGESTTDTVYEGSAIIAENGTILNTNERYSLTNQLIISDIDIDIINKERLKKSTFNCQNQEPYRTIICNFHSKEFKHLNRLINPQPFLPPKNQFETYCNEVLNIQTLGLIKRIQHTSCQTLIIGISGGLDSTLALLVSIDACDRLGINRKNIIAITMPGFGTSSRTYNNAIDMINNLGCTFKEISIKDACCQHFHDINHDINIHNATYENSQARERTQILMDIANQQNGMVIGTGDLSELALGWATYNGDHMSMYGVNAGIPKTLVRCLVEYKANIIPSIKHTLTDIINTPVSPELLPSCSEGNITQKTEDLVGPYELHDFFIYYTLKYGFTPSKILYLSQTAFEDKYDNDTIKHWYTTFTRRFFSQQFKRNCIPDGMKIHDISLSPRSDWRMPSDASSNIWLENIK